MYLGFQALYLMAMACYALAFAADLVFRNKDAGVAIAKFAHPESRASNLR